MPLPINRWTQWPLVLSMETEPLRAYTEARMSKIALEMLRDINKDTINFVITTIQQNVNRKYYQHVFQTY